MDLAWEALESQQRMQERRDRNFLRKLEEIFLVNRESCFALCDPGLALTRVRDNYRVNLSWSIPSFTRPPQLHAHRLPFGSRTGRIPLP